MDVDGGPSVRGIIREELDSVEGLRRLLGQVSIGQSGKPTLGNAALEEDRMHHVIKLNLLQRGVPAGSEEELWVSVSRGDQEREGGGTGRGRARKIVRKRKAENRQTHREREKERECVCVFLSVFNMEVGHP